MDRKSYHVEIESPEMLDYGVYLNCDRLLTCQKPISALCNADELQFQIVHQVEELWMKLINYTLVDILDHMTAREDFRVLTLFDRVHRLLRLMIQQLDILETMSPKEYQEIRLQLGNGSGQESPGFRLLIKIPADIWTRYQTYYLDAEKKTVEQVYDSDYAHDACYAVAEALTEFDELLQTFRWRHIFLIRRSIGGEAKSLKGRPVDMLKTGANHQFFPALWSVRSEMTDRWGGAYGVQRDSISRPGAS